MPGWIPTRVSSLLASFTFGHRSISPSHPRWLCPVAGPRCPSWPVLLVELSRSFYLHNFIFFFQRNPLDFPLKVGVCSPVFGHLDCSCRPLSHCSLIFVVVVVVVVVVDVVVVVVALSARPGEQPHLPCPWESLWPRNISPALVRSNFLALSYFIYSGAFKFAGTGSALNYFIPTNPILEHFYCSGGFKFAGTGLSVISSQPIGSLPSGWEGGQPCWAPGSLSVTSGWFLTSPCLSPYLWAKP